MKVNPGKYHILLSTKNAIDVILKGHARLARVKSFLKSQQIVIEGLINIFLTHAIKLAKK